MIILRIYCFYTIITIFSNAQVKAQLTIDEICIKHLEAIGGEEKINTLKNLVTEQQVMTNNIEFSQRIVIVANSAFYSKSNVMGKSVIISVKDNQGWQINPFVTGSEDAIALTPNEVKSYTNETYIKGPLIDYKEAGHKMELLPNENIKGEEAYQIRITHKSGYSFIVSISTKTFYLIKLKNSDNEVYFSDFKKVNGYVFPFSKEVRTAKTSMIVNLFKTQANTSIDPSLFIKPQ